MRPPPGSRRPAGSHPGCSGPFDPVLHGWADRTPVVGPHRGVVTVNGIFRPTVLVGGRVVGTWGTDGGGVRIRLLQPVSATDRRSLERDARRVLDFLQAAPVRAGDASVRWE